ncbi:hypothetical protein LSPH24S_02376 [Lysinibacillus sphaericus]
MIALVSILVVIVLIGIFPCLTMTAHYWVAGTQTILKIKGDLLISECYSIRFFIFWIEIVDAKGYNHTYSNI